MPPHARILACGHAPGRPSGGRASLRMVVGMDRTLPQADSDFVFGSLRLQTDGTLFRGEEAIHLTPKELAALRLLLAHPGRVVTPAELKEALWPDVHVTADSIPRCISSLRARLGSDVLIRTIYKRGYRLESSVQRVEAMESELKPRLAILPFATEMFVPEYLGAAIAEDAGTHLLVFHPSLIHLLPRDSVCALAETGLSAREVGQQLAADYVLSGRIQASTLFLRIRGQMIRVSDGAQIWAEEVMGPRDRYGVIEQQLLERLTTRLSGKGEAPVAMVSRDAQDGPDQQREEAFLLGRFDARSRDPHRLGSAVEMLFRACAGESKSRVAREHIERVTLSQCLFGYLSPIAAAEQLRRASDAIPELEQAPGALPALGWTLFHMEHNLGFALRMIHEIDPELPGAWPGALRVMLALSRHRISEALTLVTQCLQRDSWSPVFNILLAWTHHLRGDARESMDQAHRCVQMFPNDERAELCAAIILGFNDEAERAWSLAHTAAQRQSALDIAAATEAYALARLGRRDEAASILERLQWIGRERYVLTAFAAAAYAELGDEEGAIAELRTAEEARCPWFFQTLADPRLQRLHTHPEFKRMMSILESMEATVGSETECVA
ncbi:hypothetical protein DYQ86_16960 [Acidobacteria bacterium AB60]|nr:hypothetical protein DYQ86_16960 [Acidobacteria bacterium AB60]